MRGRAQKVSRQRQDLGARGAGPGSPLVCFARSARALSGIYSSWSSQRNSVALRAAICGKGERGPFHRQADTLWCEIGPP